MMFSLYLHFQITLDIINCNFVLLELELLANFSMCYLIIAVSRRTKVKRNFSKLTWPNWGRKWDTAYAKRCLEKTENPASGGCVSPKRSSWISLCRHPASKFLYLFFLSISNLNFYISKNFVRIKVKKK